MVCEENATFLTQFTFCQGKIVWADQQKTVKRLKRDYISLADLESEKPLTREKRLQLNAYEVASNAVNSEEENYGGAHRIFNDELWDQQWYLVIMLCTFFQYRSINNVLFSDYTE